VTRRSSSPLRAAPTGRPPGGARPSVHARPAASDAASTRPAGSVPWAVLLVAAVVVGTLLRAWQLDWQVLIDDEWHAVHKLLRAPVADIVSRLGYADYSIPLTLYYRFLLDHGGLSERVMHAPLLAAGVALLIVLPWLARSWTALPQRATWVALLAISPLLVYHSKIARPYALTSLLTAAAIVAFREGWRTGRASYWIAYVPGTFVAGYLNPVTLPFTLAPFLFYGLPALRDVLGGRVPLAASRLPLLLGIGALVALPLAAALLPPMINDWAQFGAKAGRDDVTPESAWRTWLMLAGTGRAAAGIAVLAFATVGVSALRRRDPDLARYLGMVLALGAVTVAATRAKWIMHPLVLARYLLPALPFLLLFVAEGMLRAAAHVRRAGAQIAIVAALVAALALAGPLPAVGYVPNQFWGHLRFQFDYDRRHNPYVQRIPQAPIPAFYRELAKLPPRSVTLVEMPWRLESNFNPHPWYQQVHRQWVKIGLVTPVCGEREFGEYPETPGMRMRWLVHLTALLRGETFGADYLVVHVVPWKTPPDEDVEWPDMSTCLPLIEARFGAPVHREDGLLVYATKPASR